MLKQLKQSAPRMLVAVLILSAVALPVIVEFAGANPPQTVSLGPQEALNISKTSSSAKNESSADPSEFFKSADRIPVEGQKGDKVWTVQFQPPPEFPNAQPFGFADHPPFGVGRPGLATGGPGLPEGGPPKGSPKRDCLEDINRQIGFYAYTKSKLQLTDGQKVAWKAVEELFDSEISKMSLLCETLPNEVIGLPSIIERSDFIEKALAVKLELIRALKAPLQQLVEQLTSAQRAVLDAPPPLPPF